MSKDDYAGAQIHTHTATHGTRTKKVQGYKYASRDILRPDKTQAPSKSNVVLRQGPAPNALRKEQVQSVVEIKPSLLTAGTGSHLGKSLWGKVQAQVKATCKLLGAELIPSCNEEDGIEERPELVWTHRSKAWLLGPRAIQLGTALRDNPHVTSLDVSFCALKPKELAVLMDALPPCVRELRLRGNSVSETEAHLVVKGLARCSRNLVWFDLRWNPVGDKGLAVLANSLALCRKIKHLDISSCGISSRSSGVMETLLARCFPVLEWLDLSLNALDAHSIESVCRGLRRCPHLEHLDLSGGPHTIAVDDSSHRAMVPGPEFRPSNSAGLDGGIAVSELVKRCGGVRHLAMRHMMLNDTAIEALALQLSLSSPDLEYLDLCGNNIEAFGAMCLSALPAKCSKIRHLDLSHNPITDRGVAALSSVFSKLPALESLNLSHTEVTKGGVCCILASLKQCPSLNLREVIVMGIK